MTKATGTLLHDDGIELEELAAFEVLEGDKAPPGTEGEELGEPDLDLDLEGADDDEDEAADGEAAARVAKEDDEDDEDADLEVSLDAILRVRFGEDNGDQQAEDDDRTGEPAALLALSEADEDDEQPRPRAANEFVCRSCFLIKHLHQLTDPARCLCVDCASA